MRKFVLFIATGAGSGYVPVAPGTAGTAVGLALWAAWLRAGLGTGWSLVGLAIGVTALGVWASGRAESAFARHDDGRIVIDEIAGLLTALVFLPGRFEVGVAGFFLFRLFDIWKPPPARQAERLGGGLGVMADDIVAGVYANLAGQVIFRGVLAWA